MDPVLLALLGGSIGAMLTLTVTLTSTGGGTAVDNEGVGTGPATVRIGTSASIAWRSGAGRSRAWP